MADVSPSAPGETVDLIREPCDCPEGDVCSDGNLFANAWRKGSFVAGRAPRAIDHLDLRQLLCLSFPHK